MPTDAEPAQCRRCKMRRWRSKNTDGEKTDREKPDDKKAPCAELISGQNSTASADNATGEAAEENTISTTKHSGQHSLKNTTDKLREQKK